MIEVVIQQCGRGTLLSEDGLAEYNKLKGGAVTDAGLIPRDDPVLIQMMKADTGKRKTAGACSRVRIVALPDGFKWKLMNTNGHEWLTSEGA